MGNGPSFCNPTGRGILLRRVDPTTGKVAIWCLVTITGMDNTALTVRVSSSKVSYTVGRGKEVGVPTKVGNVVLFYTRPHGKNAEVTVKTEPGVQVIRAGYDGPLLIG